MSDAPRGATPTNGLWAGTSQRLERVARVVRALIGAPDYEGYLRHMREHHPETQPLSREAFARQRLDERYSKPGSRCC